MSMRTETNKKESLTTKYVRNVPTVQNYRHTYYRYSTNVNNIQYYRLVMNTEESKSSYRGRERGRGFLCVLYKQSTSVCRSIDVLICLTMDILYISDDDF